MVGLALIFTQPNKTDKPANNQVAENKVQRDENVPTINLENSSKRLVEAANTVYDGKDGSVSCYQSINDLQKNLNAKIRTYLMPAKCANDAQNNGWQDFGELVFSFDTVKQVTDTSTLHSFIKTTTADGTPAIIFKINRHHVSPVFKDSIEDWVKTAAIIETSIKSDGADKKVYLFLNDDARSDQIDYQEFQNQVKALLILY